MRYVRSALLRYHAETGGIPRGADSHDCETLPMTLRQWAGRRKFQQQSAQFLESLLASSFAFRT
ncbi:hypothetical protein [Thioclava kandeliae]|uniref:Transposase n=1 Tax=Thioclava kandeliae TaxID=3070818 RepID=A0ABV1SIH3_9RHOB